MPSHLYSAQLLVKILYCTWFALQELLKVENCLFIVLFPEHNVSHHLKTNM